MFGCVEHDAYEHEGVGSGRRRPTSGARTHEDGHRVQREAAKRYVRTNTESQNRLVRHLFAERLLKSGFADQEVYPSVLAAAPRDILLGRQSRSSETFRRTGAPNQAVLRPAVGPHTVYGCFPLRHTAAHAHREGCRVGLDRKNSKEMKKMKSARHIFNKQVCITSKCNPLHLDRKGSNIILKYIHIFQSLTHSQSTHPSNTQRHLLESGRVTLSSVHTARNDRNDESSRGAVLLHVNHKPQHLPPPARPLTHFPLSLSQQISCRLNKTNNQTLTKQNKKSSTRATTILVFVKKKKRQHILKQSTPTRS